MSTHAQVEEALDEIVSILNAQRKVVEKAQLNSAGASTVLGGLGTTYGEVIATINAYDGNTPSEALAKDRLANIIAEFTALKNGADAVVAVPLV